MTDWRDATVVTVNRRLARTLRDTHDAERLAAGSDVWKSPDVLPYRAWLAREWAALADRSAEPLPVRLGPLQEQAVWEEVVAESAGPGSGRGPAGLTAVARAAREARDLLDEWETGLDALDPLHPDAEVFGSWARRVDRRAEAEGWIRGSDAADRAVGALGDGGGSPPPEVVLAGFDRLTPRQRRCLERLGARGVAHRTWHPAPRSGPRRRLAFPTREAEIEAAAGWARARVEAGDPGPVGVVLPDLERHRERVDLAFSEVFAPGSSAPGTRAGPRLYNLSAGPPLASVPVVRDGLAALALLADPEGDPGSAGHLLGSPFTGGAGPERAGRDALGAWLRARPGPLSLARLSGLRTDGPDAAPVAGVPGLVEGWARLATLAREAPRRQRAEGWARTFWQGLRCLGWPGDEALESGAYQAVAAWRELLGEFAALDWILPPMGAGRALGRVRRLSVERMFQPAADPAPVQVLGVLEAAGHSFTGLWLAGFHDGVWPRPARPNPFLPAGLVRRLGMPGASPEQELEFARRITGRLLASAGEVIASHPERDEDEALRASPLVDHIPPAAAASFAVAPVRSWFDRMHDERPRPEVLVDDAGPRRGPSSAVGAEVFRDQAACPFRGFARHRLGARAAEEARPGLDRRSRGTVVHLVLERIWRRLGGSEALARTPSGDLEALVAGAVEEALAGLEDARGGPIPGRLRDLEGRRLQALAADWLRLEAARPGFEVVAPERDRRADVGGVAVAIRPDRIDRVDGGGHLVIDYKTGDATPGAWFGPRPDEPQVPLYCVAGPAPVTGAAFGVLRAGALGFRGLAEDRDLLPGAVDPARSRIPAARSLEHWDAVLASWREALDGLAGGILSGDARVDPKVPGKTCRHCDLHALCRIDERGPGAAGDPG